MSYLEFLVEPHNLVFLGAAAAGVAVHLASGDRDLFRPAAGLVALGVWGLTLTGAVHDLRLGGIADRFPEVLLGAVCLAALSAWGAGALRDRFFPPVDEVHFNEPGLEGAEGRVVSRDVGEAPGSGRAQWHGGDGHMHLVQCHTAGEVLRFGTRVRLEEFDDEAKSYRVSEA